MDKIAQDVGDIQSRLLDHRPIVGAEIRYFVREFEEKRGHRENRLLDNLNKMVLDTNEQMLPSLESIRQQLSDVTKRLEAANHMADRVQQREQESQQGGGQLQASTDRLKDEWAEFLKEQQRLKEEVDEEHAKAVGELSTKYCEMQKDLTKLPTL